MNKYVIVVDHKKLDTTEKQENYKQRNKSLSQYSTVLSSSITIASLY